MSIRSRDEMERIGIYGDDEFDTDAFGTFTLLAHRELNRVGRTQNVVARRRVPAWLVEAIKQTANDVFGDGEGYKEILKLLKNGKVKKDGRYRGNAGGQKIRTYLVFRAQGMRWLRSIWKELLRRYGTTEGRCKAIENIMA